MYYWELTKDFFCKKEVKYFIGICLFFYITFIFLTQYSDIDYHKKKLKEKKNKKKLENSKQKKVSLSEI